MKRRIWSRRWDLPEPTRSCRRRGLFIAGWGSFLYFKDIRRYRLDWLWGARIAVAIILLISLSLMLGYPAVWARLSPTLSPSIFLISLAASMAMVLLLLAAFLWAGLDIVREALHRDGIFG
ncbi:MAG: hypothetical protein PHT33_00860 [bacterium]|nr:hypothetical protein [bacterium]